MGENLLTDLHILVMEDEFLIALDLEQIFRDNGAAEVTIVREVADDLLAGPQFHAAVIDLMLSGTSTVAFAEELFARRIPFVFATGYTDVQELARSFPGVEVVEKPYSTDVIVTALAQAISRAQAEPSGGV